MSNENGITGLPDTYGAVCLIRKQRRKRRKLLMIELFLDFAKNTTLHGLRYVTEAGLHVIEKVFWMITFLISVSMCFYLIYLVWLKWKNSPVIVSFSQTFVPVGMVPFPSVTICPQHRINRKFYNYAHEYEKYYIETNPDNLTFDEPEMASYQKFEDVSLICGMKWRSFLLGANYVFKERAHRGTRSIPVRSGEEFALLYNRARLNNSVVKNIEEASSKNIFFKCIWHGYKIACNRIFKTVLTAEGVCFNFNSLSQKEMFHMNEVQNKYPYIKATKSSKGWSLEREYFDDNLNVYPKRGSENGVSPDLELFLNQDEDEDDESCNSVNSGYKIYVQHPTDVPQSSLYYYAALNDQVSSLALKFSHQSTDPALKNYKADIRQCYFPEDRPLRYFKIYTESNCRLECQSNFTFSRCKCVWFHMPHKDSREVCTVDKETCMVEAKENLTAEEIKGRYNKASNACNCLPACNSVQYDAEILKTYFNFTAHSDILKKMLNISSMRKNIKYSKIELYFKEPRFVSIRRSELFGVTDFLANCGGLLGLFLGFSFLSLVEIFYFITLRLFYTFKRDLKQEKKAQRSIRENNQDKPQDIY